MQQQQQCSRRNGERVQEGPAQNNRWLARTPRRRRSRSGRRRPRRGSYRQQARCRASGSPSVSRKACDRKRKLEGEPNVCSGPRCQPGHVRQRGGRRRGTAPSPSCAAAPAHRRTSGSHEPLQRLHIPVPPCISAGGHPVHMTRHALVLEKGVRGHADMPVPSDHARWGKGRTGTAYGQPERAGQGARSCQTRRAVVRPVAARCGGGCEIGKYCLPGEAQPAEFMMMGGTPSKLSGAGLFAAKRFEGTIHPASGAGYESVRSTGRASSRSRSCWP